MSILKSDFLYGLSGGLIGTILSHPFDTIKTRIQSEKANSIINAIKQKKLYAGIIPPLFGIMMEKSVVFGFYDIAKKNNYNDFVSGIFSGLMCTAIVVPIDRLKITLQNKQQINFKSLNLNYLYKGTSITFFRETPGFGIYFTTYNYLNNNFNNNNSLYYNFIFGALSGLNAWNFIYPSDLIKTNMQANNTNLILTIRHIYFNYGISGFYRGFSLAVMRAMPLHGGVFLGYELSKKYF